MQEAHWEHFEHGADIGLRAVGPSREAMFEAMAEALTAVVTDPQDVRPESEVAIRCEAPDDALLLADWLNALIYEMATRRMLFSRWRVSIDGQRLSARVAGETIDRARHQPVVEVKGTTYTALAVEHAEDGSWTGQCIVDV